MTRPAAIALLALCGCADIYKLTHGDPPSFDNRSEYPDQFFLHVWSEVETLARVDISLSGIAVTIHEDEGDYRDACPDIERLGCGDETSINIRGSVGTDAVDVGAEVAHQLGHLHLSRTDDGYDGRHAHAEWFGEDGVEAKIRDLIEAGGIK